MAIVTSRDVQDIVSKLSSDKAKTREEGIKLLNTWLEGEKSPSFCKFIAQKTAKLKADEIRHSETWPFLVTLLTQCVSLEISSSKKRLPKLIFAKTLRIVIQRAEDPRFSGKMLPLLSVVRSLFTHLWDVLRDVQSFQSEYGVILRHLLGGSDYHLHMRKRIYCGLVLLYMEKVESSLSTIGHSNPKEEVFRYILTLHSLLENPPGDFSDSLREDIVKKLVTIVSYVRDEGKVSRKLIECINMFLVKDGPNLGDHALEIHNAMQHFVFRYWLTTHDQGLKDALVSYAKLQLNLVRDDDASILVEKLLDVIVKELDQGSSVMVVPWSDSIKDDKYGTLTSSQCSLVELAAVVLYKACVDTRRTPLANKRARRENAATHLREEIIKGKWLWNATFCWLTHNYNARIGVDFFIYCFEGIYTSLTRILNDANMGHAYYSLLWTLRGLQELSSVLLIPNLISESSNRGWHTIWDSVMHGLPIFSNVTAVVDVSLTLLGDLVLRDLINTSVIVPRDVWDLQIFKHLPSASALYFITCYFSRRGSQGDIRDNLLVRRNLLGAVLGLCRSKQEGFLSNERMLVLLPAAVYALCTGFSVSSLYGELFPLHSFAGFSEARSNEIQVSETEHDACEYSVEVIADYNLKSSVKVGEAQKHRNVRLPRQLRDPLLQEMQAGLQETIANTKNEIIPLSRVFYLCAFLCNLLCSSLLTRLHEDLQLFMVKLGHAITGLVDNAVCEIELFYNDVQSDVSLSLISVFDGTSSLLASFRCFTSSPLFVKWRNEDVIDDAQIRATVRSIERFLQALGKLYEKCSVSVRNIESEALLADSSNYCDALHSSNSSHSSKSRIMDMELDVDGDSKKVDILSVEDAGISSSALKWKLDIVSLISCCFRIVPSITWITLFDLMEGESDPKVCEKILCSLCEHPHWPSSTKLINLILHLDKMIERQSSLKLEPSYMTCAIGGVLGSLLSSDADAEDKCDHLSLRKRASQKDLGPLGDLVNKVAEFDLNWCGRTKLIDCICKFILIDPQIGQTMIERLLLLLSDPDYRVRLFLARQLGVLFQTWEGHDELFNDICSNFGPKLVMSTKVKLVTAAEVLAVGPQPRTVLETIIVTLMHLAHCSEKIEYQAIFMMCAVAAVNPGLRGLITTAFDNLSKQFHYAARFQYLEQLMGPIIFSWVSCGLSLPSLVEIRDLFVLNEEPQNFVQSCCCWLLPALILREDAVDLKWLAMVSGQPLAILVKSHFVPIFSICLGFHCSENSGSEKGLAVLQGAILHLAEISENERDILIRKHMVSTVSYILSLASSSSDAALPLLPKNTVVLAIHTVIDGFLEIEDHATGFGVIDKINIFRPDRVFMFLVELHYKIAAAIHYRHKCHRLAGIEVLVDVLGQRASASSTSNYLFNLVGQYIDCGPLQDQCFRIISMLLRTFKGSYSEEINSVLGEQLQFLVSKLVACCVPFDTYGKNSGAQSAQVVSLLHHLIVDSDPSLYDFIRELEPFPELVIFDRIRKFHQGLCEVYSPRDHFLRFVKRSCNMPPRLLSWSLQALHQKLLEGETFLEEYNKEDLAGCTSWHSDHEIVDAVWRLVRLCGSNDATRVRTLASDFIARVGIGDPHCVVFHLPGDSNRVHVCRPITMDGDVEISFQLYSDVPDELMVSLLRLLKKYLMDESVKIIDMTSQALRGILSTERGQKVLGAFDCYERSLIEVHSKGLNMNLVEKLLLDLETKCKVEATSLDVSGLWTTQSKTFEAWICPLVYSLIAYCDDIILRLCQDIVLLNAEVAEILLPSVIVNLAGRKDCAVDLHGLISLQLQENVLIESNKLMKSIQVVLSALNELRLCHVVGRNAPSTKFTKSSSCSSKVRFTSTKCKDSTVGASRTLNATSAWGKVYWLSLDYLVVAKLALSCGSYFTSVLYVEHWCVEHFNSLSLGTPDFSHIDKIPDHINILLSAVTQINEPDSLYGIIQSNKLSSQIITFEHEGNWSKALEYYDLLVRSDASAKVGYYSRYPPVNQSQSAADLGWPKYDCTARDMKSYKGVIRSLQQIGCTHLLDLYCQGLTAQEGNLQDDLEFTELQLLWLNTNWRCILKRTQLHMSLLEPFIAFREVLLQILGCKDIVVEHLLQGASTLRKGTRYSQAAAALHEFKFFCHEMGVQESTLYWNGRLEEAKLLRAQGQHDMAINLAKYVSENYSSDEDASNVYRLVGKWLAETRSSNSRIILEKYLKHAVSLAGVMATDKNSMSRKSQMQFNLAHYADALFRSYEERLSWQAAMRLRDHKAAELEALIKRVKSSTKGGKTDYSLKILELQKQLAMDKEEAEKLQDD